ncbi:MAG: hypothetical protein IJ899_09465 [Blautia sp.]|nr:hypothetical protein [Blautia sp.]
MSNKAAVTEIILKRIIRRPEWYWKVYKNRIQEREAEVHRQKGFSENIFCVPVVEKRAGIWYCDDTIGSSGMESGC